MGMADQHRPRAEQEIDIFLALFVPYAAALTLRITTSAGKLPKVPPGSTRCAVA
jgi:hypothetical protein